MSSKRFAGEVIWGSCALGFNETCFGFCVFAQTGRPKLCLWQAQAGPAKTMSLTKWSSKICPWQAQSRSQAWHSGTKILSLAGPTKTCASQIQPQTFICGRPSQDPNLAICIAKILTLLGPAKTMSLTKWSSNISSAAGPVKLRMILELHFCKAHGLCWACQRQNFCTADVCRLDWACRG